MATLEQVRPTDLQGDSEPLDTDAEPLDSDAEALFREAKQRERRRRLAWLAALLAVVGVAIAAVARAQSGSGSDAVSPPAQPAAPPQPVAGAGTPLTLPADGTIVLLLDTSGSMLSNDVAPSRFDAAVSALERFIGAVPASTEVGLVAFGGGNAQLSIRPTTDRATLLNTLDQLQPQGGSALGDALVTAVGVARQSLADQGVAPLAGQLPPAAIVLVTDGGQNRGTHTPGQAAAVAKGDAIRVVGITVGTGTGQVSFGSGTRAIHAHIPTDPAAVAAISSATGGESFDATSGAELDAIGQQIASGIG
jgi:Ca-activated chloride channel family protein